MAKITYQQRKKLPASDFVFPKKRKYHIEDIAHARNALSRISRFGTASQIAKVRAAVYKRYPGLRKRKLQREKHA